MITFIAVVITIAICSSICLAVVHSERAKRTTSLNEENKQKIKELQIQYDLLNNTITNLSHKKDKINSEIDALDDKYKSKINNLDLLYNQEVERTHNEEAKLHKTLLDKNAELQNLHETISEKKDAIEAMETRITASNSELGRLVNEIDGVRSDLKDLKDQHRKALLENWVEEKDAPGYIFDNMTEKEARLAELVAHLQVEYRELSEDFGKIVWSKIWMPKIQSWVKMYGLDSKVNCVYRLVSLEDERVCYVGQAVNLKERWYTHIKKMVGAEGRGGERLYEKFFGSPDKLRWEIVEEGIEGKERLNERERYWIEYFGCVEIGLNRK